MRTDYKHRDPLQVRRLIAGPIALLLSAVVLVMFIIAIWSHSGEMGGTAAVLLAPLIGCALACLDWEDS